MTKKTQTVVTEEAVQEVVEQPVAEAETVVLAVETPKATTDTITVEKIDWNAILSDAYQEKESAVAMVVKYKMYAEAMDRYIGEVRKAAYSDSKVIPTPPTSINKA
jgi:hypothetical protein